MCVLGGTLIKPIRMSAPIRSFIYELNWGPFLPYYVIGGYKRMTWQDDLKQRALGKYLTCMEQLFYQMSYQSASRILEVLILLLPSHVKLAVFLSVKKHSYHASLVTSSILSNVKYYLYMHHGLCPVLWTVCRYARWASHRHCHDNGPPLACRSPPHSQLWSWHTLQTPFCLTSPPVWPAACSFPG